VIEREVADVNQGINDGRIRRAGGFEGEIGAAFDGEAIGMDLADAGEIEIISRNVETEGSGDGIVGSAAG